MAVKQAPKEFPLNKLPAVLQAEISKKLKPQEFGALLCSSKEVSRNIKKYASLSYDTYLFDRQQNVIKNFIKPILKGKNNYNDNFLFSNYYYGTRSKKVDMVLECIYLFNLNQNKNKKIFFLQRLSRMLFNYLMKYKLRKIKDNLIVKNFLNIATMKTVKRRRMKIYGRLSFI